MRTEIGIFPISVPVTFYFGSGVGATGGGTSASGGTAIVKQTTYWTDGGIGV